MVGAFKLVINNKVSVYEIMTIVEIENTLLFRLKHFNADLISWEEKDESVDFKLVKVTPNKVFFDGLSLEKISEEEINVFVVLENNGVKNEVKFNYKRRYAEY